MWHAWEWRWSWTDFWLGNVEERVQSEGLCEYGRIILKWMLRKCIRMVCDCSCLGRALNNVLMNPVMNLEFRKLLGNLTRRAVICNFWKYCVLYVFSFVISDLQFCSDMHFFFCFTQHLNYCLKLFSVFLHNYLNSDGSKWCSFYCVISLHTLGRSICQWLSLLLSGTFTVKCYSYWCCAVVLLL